MRRVALYKAIWVAEGSQASSRTRSLETLAIGLLMFAMYLSGCAGRNDTTHRDRFGLRAVGLLGLVWEARMRIEQVPRGRESDKYTSEFCWGNRP